MPRIFHYFSSLFRKPQSDNSKLHRTITADLIHFSRMEVDDLLKNFETQEHGLEEEVAEDRLEKYGLNVIAHERPPSWYQLLSKNFANPFNALLLILGLISFLLHDIDATIIIGVMVALSVSMRFIQEFRSSKAAEKLQALVSTKATVFRKQTGQPAPIQEEIRIKFLVPGDIIHLSAGDMVPGDVRLLSSKELFISQSALTGESMPVEKNHLLSEKDLGIANPLEMPNLCFMGTNVLNGSATAIVLSTGNSTYFGSMAKTLTGYRPLTSFDIGVSKVGWLLIKLTLVMAPAVFLINGLTKHDWIDSLLFALSVAVGLTPEMLPMIVTANLARGAINMSHKKVIVKRLNAIQNFGAMDILCTDKTGTLTQDKVILIKYLGVEGNENEEVFKLGYINSFYQTGLKNLLDVAILERMGIEHKNELDLKCYKKIDELPFDFVRRRMSVVVQKDPDKHLLICKGALEELLNVCDNVRINGAIAPLTGSAKEQVLNLKKELNEDGLRVIAVAYKEIPNGKVKEYKLQDESSLVLLGYLAFLDPPKETTKEAIANLRKANVQIKILTGDNEIITRKICNWVNLEIQGLLLGPEIEQMNDEELKKAVDKTTIFAKLAPMQKSRVIKLLKSNGHTVGYLGDGINDASALRESDVGISVDTAVDIAKESADIIMLEKSLLFLADGVLEGRKTFGNIIKYIKMAVSSNFGNVFSVLGSSALLPFLPMKSIQLLTQNLLYDISQTTIPFDNVDKEFLLSPRKWDPHGIARFMVFIGPISSLFDYATFALMWYFFGANSIEKQSLFQAGWFIEGLLSQTLIVHMIRTQKIPFLQSTASLPLLLTTFIVMAIGIYIPFSFIGSSIGLTPLPWSYFPWLIAILLAYCTLTQAVKLWFIKKFHYWL